MLEFNWSNLPLRLQQRVKKLKKLGQVTNTPDGPLVYIDNGAKVLGVAHMDAVGFTPVRYTATRWDQRCIVNAMQLDDRLGVCILLDILPQLGLKYDILLCDGEEQCRTTAAHFETSKDYNWMFEFDRAGTDVVMYDYETLQRANLLESYGFDVGHGSYTDICRLGHLGCTGFNFGCGYRGAHTKACDVDLLDTEWMIRKFAVFFDEMHATKLDYVPVPVQRGSRGWGHWTGASRYTQLGIQSSLSSRELSDLRYDSWKYRDETPSSDTPWWQEQEEREFQEAYLSYCAEDDSND